MISFYDYRNRAYSPDLGRFLQTDPIRFNAGDVNLYRYVGNGPVNFVDPWGLERSVTYERWGATPAGPPPTQRQKTAAKGAAQLVGGAALAVGGVKSGTVPAMYGGVTVANMGLANLAIAIFDTGMPDAPIVPGSREKAVLDSLRAVPADPPKPKPPHPPEPSPKDDQTDDGHEPWSWEWPDSEEETDC